ncbi:MAG: porin [Candidatus Contendobacter sp.]|nr:porin [Candidatus Contendobacter sp.]MDG4556538.1 porin [Candidatus Contendobacter sp.]
MKKSVLALAVAATLAAPLAAQADTILYGSARVSVDYNDDDNLFNLFEGDANWDVVNNASRLGVQGSEDLGGGLSAVYQYEFGVDVTDGGNLQGDRPKFVGLKGGFGQLTVGTQVTPYYEVVGINDIFNTSLSFGPTVWLGGSNNGFVRSSTTDVSNAQSGGTLERLPSSVYYSTPDFGGFSASAMLVMASSITRDGVGTFPTNERDGWSDGIDEWTVALKYTNGPFFVGATYIALNGRTLYDSAGIPVVDLDRDQWGIGVGYQTGAFSIGLTYEQGTLNQWGVYEPLFAAFGGLDTPWSAYLTGSYTFGNNVISAAYGQLDTGLSGADPIQNYALGYQYNFSKRTRLWIEYVGRDAQQPTITSVSGGTVFISDPGTIFYGDQNGISIGTRVDF